MMKLHFQDEDLMNTFSLFSAEHIAKTYVFFDFETTGFYPLDTDRIIEIAMIKITNGSVVDKFETFINPLRLIPEQASEVNHITNEMVKDYSDFNKDICIKTLNFIQDSILVAHNSSFDLGFLAMELAKHGISFTSWRSIDTLKIAKSVFPAQKNKLKNLIDRYNIKQEGDLHRAMVDTEALVDVFFNLVDEEKIRNLSDDEIVAKFGYTGDIESLNKSIPQIVREAMENATVLKADYKTRDGKILKLNFIPVAPVWNSDKWYVYVNNVKTNKHFYIYCNRLSNVFIGE
ncbi:MAG TPA: hypothetical protein DDY71_03485 [Spirochaetia bacterium]|nr:hypothetical protein [Spirochaetia bacterium]HBI36688.1 hypothetical protein [Spirochaetia bacterium]